VPFHLWITPDDHRAFFGIKRWNIDEERLLSQFVEPYRTGRPITTDGEVVSTDQLQKMRIARSDVQLAPRVERSCAEQGVPVKITDPLVLAEVARILSSGRPRRSPSER